MKKIYNSGFLTILVLLLIAINPENIQGQCTNSSSYGSATAPSGTTAVTISTCNYQTEYSVISGVVAGNQYQATYDLGGYITVHSGSYNGTVVASGNAPLTWTAAVSGTHYIHYNTNSSCGTNTSCGTSTLSCVSCGGGTPSAGTCLDAIPFCTSDSYTFPANTNVASLGSVGCLYTTPNPAWYWMQIGDPGNIDIYMSSGGDVDFIAWGPFSSLSAACASDLMSNSGVDCSYSTAAQETANLTNTQTGEVYVLLITNYANIVTNISFSQTSGGGSTNCGIIAPPITNNGPICEGETLQLTVSNPTTGATYSWTGPNSWSSTEINPTIPNVTTQNAGTYSLVITVGADTSPPVTTDVVINPSILPSFASSGPYCTGESISALPTTSTNSITGSWSPAINNTATTTYTYTPSSGQCALTTTMQIIINDDLLPTFNPVGPYCYGTSIPPLPGTSTNEVTGSWLPAINNTTTTNYTFTPTTGQCATSTTLEIEIGFLESEVVNTSDQFCDAFGTAEINGLNGTEPYNYLWPSNASGISEGQATELTVGNYSITISDANGCQTTQDLTIGFTDNLNATATLISNPACYGEATGSIALNFSNGTEPYNIAWDTSLVVSNFANYNATNLYAGEYTFDITDANGCESTANLTLTDPPLLIATSNYIQIACSGELATVTVTANGGTPSYSGIGTFEINSGSYTYTVTDNNGCTASTDVTIPDAPAPLEITATITDLNCNNSNDGTITIITTGGTTPYYYDWTNSDNSSSITNLSPGIYSVTITDFNNCSQEGTYTVIEPSSINLLFTTEDVLCYGTSDGSIHMSADGGIPPFSYDIYNIQYSANGADHNNLPADSYTIRVRDANGCYTTKNTVISSPSELELSVSTIDPSCIGNDDGIIEIYVSGGTSPYSYILENMLFPDGIITRLSEGNYDAEIIDANNCIKHLYLINLTDNPIDCIKIPNTFTPNGDGINDTWIVEGLETFPTSIIQVFNRWGQSVYYESTSDKEWDGQFNGKLIPSGTYVYYLNLFNGDAPYTGTITVVH